MLVNWMNDCMSKRADSKVSSNINTMLLYDDGKVCCINTVLLCFIIAHALKYQLLVWQETLALS
jgi:hypothetical protein